jgi:hypothetical protein
MIPCPKGAILTMSELQVAAAAAQLAVEHLAGIIETEKPNGRRPTLKEQARLNPLRSSLRDYQKHLRTLERAIKAKRRG